MRFSLLGQPLHKFFNFCKHFELKKNVHSVAINAQRKILEFDLFFGN